MRRKFMVFMVLTSMLLTAGLTGGCVGFVRSEQRAEITGTDKTKSLAEAEITAHIPENVSAKNAAADPSANSSEGFVLVAEAVPDVIQEIRYYSTYNFVGERIDGYEAVRTFDEGSGRGVKKGKRCNDGPGLSAENL